LERLALYLAAQDVRTPTNYLESMARWEVEIPLLLRKTIESSFQRIQVAKNEKRGFHPVDSSHPYFQDLFRVEVLSSESIGEYLLSAEVTTGRKLWLESIRFLLNETAKEVLKHKWSIAYPSNGIEWLTSDHPVVRLNYYCKGIYDLRGGWGKQGADLIMPLSPRHLLITEIGMEQPDRLSFMLDQTVRIQKILADRAFRWIFSRTPAPSAPIFHPRRVDFIAYRNEEEQIRNWHKAQSKN
jgi:hypothetical protein